MNRREFVALPAFFQALIAMDDPVKLTGRDGPCFMLEGPTVHISDSDGDEILAAFVRELTIELRRRKVSRFQRALSSRHILGDCYQSGCDFKAGDSVMPSIGSWIEESARAVAARIHANAKRFGAAGGCDPVLLMFRGDLPGGVDMASGAEVDGVAARFVKHNEFVRFDVYYRFV